MNIVRPQDVYVLLALIAGHENIEWTYDQLTTDQGCSPSSKRYR